MRTAFVLVCLCVLTGCAGTVSPSQLEPPAKILLVSPKPLPTIKAGDDLVQRHADLRRSYSTETDRYRRLQRWVKTVIKK
jgi:hypothetical protein